MQYAGEGYEMCKKSLFANLKRIGLLENLDNIRKHLKEIECEAGDCTHVAQFCD
jgi:hypothetical protein